MIPNSTLGTIRAELYIAQQSRNLDRIASCMEQLRVVISKAAVARQIESPSQPMAISECKSIWRGKY